MTLPLLPGPPEPRECLCGTPVPKGPLVQGYGSGCARKHGLTAPSIARPRSDAQDGPTLLDLLNQDAPAVSSPGNVVCRQRTDAEDEAVRVAETRRGLTGG